MLSTSCFQPTDGKPCNYLLMLADLYLLIRLWYRRKTLSEKLNNGITLVVDRYAFSGVAFSSAKGLDLEWCRNPDIGLLTPDIVLFLDLTIDQAEKRGGFGQERYEKRELQIKVRDEFTKLQDDTWKVRDEMDSCQSLFIKLWCSLSMRANPRNKFNVIFGMRLRLSKRKQKIQFSHCSLIYGNKDMIFFLLLDRIHVHCSQCYFQREGYKLFACGILSHHIQFFMTSTVGLATWST